MNINSKNTGDKDLFKPSLLTGAIFPPPPPHIPIPPQPLSLPIFDGTNIIPPPNRPNSSNVNPSTHLSQQLSEYPVLLESVTDSLQQTKKRKKKSRKVKRACVACKKSHTSCSDQRPCERCIRLGLEDSCVDAKSKKRGRKRKLKDRGKSNTETTVRRKKRKLNNQQSQNHPTQIVQPPPPPPHIQQQQQPQSQSHQQSDFIDLEENDRLKEDFVSSHCFGLSSRYQNVGLLLLQPDIEGVISTNWTMRTWLGETGTSSKLSEMTSHRERIVEEIRKNENPVAYDIEIENVVFNNQKSGEMVNTKIRVHIMYDVTVPEESQRLLVILFIEKIT